VGNKKAFYRFLKACAARTAQILKFDLARDAVALNSLGKLSVFFLLFAICQ